MSVDITVSVSYGHYHANKSSLDLITITNTDWTTSQAITIPAERCLEKIIVWVSSNQNIKVGDSASTGEYWDGTVTTSEPLILTLDLFSVAGQTVYVSGTSGSVKYYIA